VGVASWEWEWVVFTLVVGGGATEVTMCRLHPTTPQGVDAFPT